MPHLVVLGVCLAMLAAAVAIAAVGHVDGLLHVGAVAIPELCGFRNVTGLPCAGCGLTRSWVALAAGEPATSLEHNRVGWLVMLYVMAQALRHGAWLASERRRIAVESWGRWLDRGLVVLVAVLLVSWVVTLAAIV